MDFTQTEIRTYYTARIPHLKPTEAREWRVACPVHQGARQSLAINATTGVVRCHSQCGRGWDLIGFEMALSGKVFVAAKAEVFRLIGRPEPRWDERDIESTFDYTDAQSRILYQVVRRTGKRFSQRRPDGKGGWTWGIGGVTAVPFRLPSVLSGDLVWIVEGEKDVLTLERLGFVASCNSGGAGNFKPSLAEWFARKNVAILADFDEAGRAHALKVAALLAPIAESLRIVELPDLPPKGDVSDFVAQGGTAEQIRDAYQRACDWTPEWEFITPLSCEGDTHVKRFAEVVSESGGLDRFWDLARQEGIPTPFARLTEALGGGLRSSEVYVLGGNQGSGKTSLALQFILTALRARKGVLLFSMEMAHRDVFQRLCGILGRVDLIEFREAQRDPASSSQCGEMRRKLAQAGAELDGLPLLVSTRAAITPEFIVTETARLKTKQKIDLTVVDHLQLMTSAGGARAEYERFTAISRALKQTAMELNIPLLIISQASRANSSERRAELDVHDLRGSGAIEEDCAAAMLIYPDADDRARAIKVGTFAKGPIKSWLKLAKNRYGLQGSYLPLLHHKTVTQFAELEGSIDGE